jgi:FMN phosphatase YigB (HAD superfamily)
MDNAKFLAGVAAVFTDIGWFDTSHYVGLYPDTAAYPLGPARHYIDFGIAEKRVPRADSLLPYLRELFSKFFRLNLLPGVEADNAIAFLRWMLMYSRHFEALGGCTGRGLAAVSAIFRKTPAFRSVAGFKVPAGLSEREIVVLLICRGEQELVSRMLAEAIQMSGNDRSGQLETIRKSGYFDDAFYLAANPDVAAAGADPVLHYLEHGAAEKRDPSAKFSSEFYLANYTDVAAARLNPLLHFLEHGRAEGRQPLPALLQPARRTDAGAPDGQARPHLTALLAQLVTDRSIRAVSFDFFDTLVERKHPDPHMVFVTMAAHSAVKDTGIRDFKAVRVEAERLARSLKSTEVTLADIYRQLGRLSGLSEHETALLAELEKAAELDTLTVRPLGVAMLEHARQRKLKLAITSDFYIGKDFLCEVMRKLNIRHDDITVFVSAESGDTKHDGRLFDTVARVLNIPKKQILHIGDNAVSDYRQPLARGLAAGLVPTSLGLISARSRIDEIVVHGRGSGNRGMPGRPPAGDPAVPSAGRRAAAARAA